MTSTIGWAHLFEAEVSREFGDVCARYGLKHEATHIRPPECWVTYLNSTTRMRVSFEAGSGPWVEFERLKRFVISRERYDLAFVLMERAPEEEQQQTVVDLDDPALGGELQRLAELVSLYAGDILSGDFSVFPALAEHARRNLERRNRELFGDIDAAKREQE
jgi:hypothetical protein